MSKQFAVIRIYKEDCKHFKDMADKIGNDIYKITGKKMKVTMPMVIKAVTPQFNKNMVEIDLTQFKNTFRRRRK